MSPDCFAAYEDKLTRELHRRDLIIINLERLLEALEKSIADIKDKRETTPYRDVSDICDSTLKSLSKEIERVERRIEEHLYSIAPSAVTLVGHRILAKMLAHAGSFRALAFMPSSRLQVLGAEKGLFSSEGKTPKHGYIFQHPEVKGAARDERGKKARRLACALALALRKDFFSSGQENMYADESLKPRKARANERSKLFYLFELRPELVDHFRGRVLYLGAGSGSTAKRLARISERLYCVEVSPFPFSSLIEIAKRRENMCPILEDANDPASYGRIVDRADILYQDITQKNQVDIFLKNMSFFSIERGVLVVKASSIDARRPADLIFGECAERLVREGYSFELVDMREEFRNHAAIIAEKI